MNPTTMLINAARRLDAMFPGFYQTTTKRNHYIDYGYPENISFEQFWQMYRRNGFGQGAIEKTILKTWQTNPAIQEGEEAEEKTQQEKDIADRFTALRFWQKLAEADRRSLVGKYAGVIFRFADSKTMKEPVDTVPGGLEGLVEIIPAWEGQLIVSTWDTDEASENYGQPTMFQFNEAAVGDDQTKTRSFEVHPDRVFIWSKDEMVHGESYLSAGYNDLITVEKVIGAGGEGFWKNAKSAPVLEVDKDANANDMAKQMGVEPDELADKMNEQVEDYQKGFDALLMLQGIEAKTLNVTLPLPSEFAMSALQSFAASITMPIKILVGMQTGERASTEDQKEWSQTCMARRENIVIPNIMAIIGRLVSVKTLPEKAWSLDWADLTESSMSEKIERADKMASINEKQSRAGGLDPVFSSEEMRETVGLKPELEADIDREEDEE